MLKAVLFDLDGTLCDSLADLAAATNHTLRHFGYAEHPLEAYRYLVGNGIPKLLERALPEGHKTAEDVERAKKVFFDYYRVHFADLTVGYPGMPELVGALKQRGLRLAVCTNKAQEMAEAVAAAVYGQAFDLVCGQREGVPTKPDPTLALALMKKLGVKPGECIFLGDSGVDMQTAVNCGARAVGVLWGFREADELNENGAEFLIEKPEELLPLMDALNS